PREGLAFVGRAPTRWCNTAARGLGCAIQCATPPRESQVIFYASSPMSHPQFEVSIPAALKGINHPHGAAPSTPRQTVGQYLVFPRILEDDFGRCNFFQGNPVDLVADLEAPAGIAWNGDPDGVTDLLARGL